MTGGKKKEEDGKEKGNKRREEGGRRKGRSKKLRGKEVKMKVGERREPEREEWKI